MKHLSTIANSVLEQCSVIIGVPLEDLNEEFERGYKAGGTDDCYSRKIFEFCSSRALCAICRRMEFNISESSFSRLTFDMMLAWENPSSLTEESYMENVAKEREERMKPPNGGVQEAIEDIPLFYSDLMPLLVDDERNIGEDAFVWFSSVIPLAADILNARFAFETLTASTAGRLHYPAYDRFFKEIDKCIKYLQKPETPACAELAEDEFILHVEGTAMTQRVVRHIGGTSWPGRLTLTNSALYFEASGVISYEDAIRIDLSEQGVDYLIMPSSTGPWGAPIFDKAMIYKSSKLQEGVVFEFPEMTSSTRRDHWLTLIKEVTLLHQFLARFKIESRLQRWEAHARMILGIVRLHAAREMLRIFPPIPTNFLIFTLFDESPKGDLVLEELANGLRQTNSIHPCSPTSILRSMNVCPPYVWSMGIEEKMETSVGPEVAEDLASLESTISQVREEAKEIEIAKASVEGLKEEGITDSIIVLQELLSPLRGVWQWFQAVLKWERPTITLFVLATSLLIIYKEWIWPALAAILVWMVGLMLWVRRKRVRDKCKEIVICTSSDQTPMESIVSAQHALHQFYNIVQTTNIAILKSRSIFESRAPKHTNMVMWAMVGMAIVLIVVPLKYLLMGILLYVVCMNSKAGRSMSMKQSNKRLKAWWDSIPVVSVRTVSGPCN
ncbi:hypothetical protein AMTRI_Chr03g149220 [Amborella trichopoda]